MATGKRRTPQPAPARRRPQRDVQKLVIQAVVLLLVLLLVLSVFAGAL